MKYLGSKLKKGWACFQEGHGVGPDELILGDPLVPHDAVPEDFSKVLFLPTRNANPFRNVIIVQHHCYSSDSIIFANSSSVNDNSFAASICATRCHGIGLVLMQINTQTNRASARSTCIAHICHIREPTRTHASVRVALLERHIHVRESSGVSEC